VPLAVKAYWDFLTYRRDLATYPELVFCRAARVNERSGEKLEKLILVKNDAGTSESGENLNLVQSRNRRIQESPGIRIPEHSRIFHQLALELDYRYRTTGTVLYSITYKQSNNNHGAYEYSLVRL